MDPASSTTASAIVALRFKNFAASAAIVTFACALYRIVPSNQKNLGTFYSFPAFSFTGEGFLIASALVYTALFATYFLSERDPRISKSLRFFRVIAAFARAPAQLWRQGLSDEERVAVLTTLLKTYFAPLMGVSLMIFCMGALANGAAIASNHATMTEFRVLFDQHGFWFLLQLILFVDVLIFTVGYLVEMPRLRNEIRSVDPTMLGWAATLLCYPPFNAISAAILGSKVSDFPIFENSTAHVAFNVVLLALMAIYASASVALGFKASNLTHRGVVARGPYAIVRHPAYSCKNLAWWIAAMPKAVAKWVLPVPVPPTRITL
jgi:protein-S-isoprenylcysteine O-methyltransferase Ste14